MTRRTVALSLAVAVVWVTPVVGGQDAGAPPDASLRSITVADWDTGGARTQARTAAGADTAAWATSAPLDAGDAVLVGADWGGDPDTEVQVRSRDADGWGQWVDLHADVDEHVPDAGSAEAAGVSTGSEPVWVGRVDQLQFRTQGEVEALDVDLVDVAGDLEYDPGTAGRGAAVAAPETPFIRPRSSWGADESLRDGQVSYADDVRFSVIHHEGGAPRWSQADIDAGCKEAAAAINSVYEYHTKGRGYWDIAYNFVVDPCGRIWEGRAGGVDRPVMGAHAGGWNSGSVGVLALGTFTPGGDRVTDALVNGIEKLLTWKLDLHHTDPRGTTREVSGGGSSRYPSGTSVNVPILSAHQITNSTGCPGEGIMARLFDGRAGSATPKSSYVNTVYRTGLPKAFDTLGQQQVIRDGGDLPSWQAEFTEPLDWSLRISDENGDVVRRTGGTDETTMDRTWDLRDQAGEVVNVGTYTATITGTGASGSIGPVVSTVSVAPVARRAGEDRVATSVALSRWAFDRADTVILASAGAYPDALVSGPLAGKLDAPVLLTHRDGLHWAVEHEIERLGAENVYVVGGPVALSDQVERDVNALAGVTATRLGGEDRFATAALVADKVLAGQPATEVLLSLGRHEDESRAFPDALSAGAFGADLTLPVLLTNRDELPKATRTALSDMDPDTLTVFGGTVAITDPVVRTARRITGAATSRFAGETRYDTSRLAAEDLLARRAEAPDADASPTPSESDTATPSETASPSASPSPSETASTTPEEDRIDVIFASGGNWPDALGAGAAAAKTGSVFLLTHPDDLDDSPHTRQFLQQWEDRLGDASVAGGPVAVANRVLTAIAAYVPMPSHLAPTEPIAWPGDPNPDTSTPSDEPSAP